MLDSYRRVLSRPGALAFSSAALVARLPISMVGLGIVLLVEGRTGSYGLAGTVSAVFVLSEAAFAVLHGRWVDHHGQARVLPLAISVFGAGLALMMLAVEQDWARPWTHVFAAVAGAALPQVGASVRTRWSHLLDDAGEKQTAFALEAVLDEVVFVVGPVLVTLLATGWHPVAGLTVAVVTGLVGTYAFAAQRSTEPPAGRSAPSGGDRTPMPWRLVLPLAVVCLTLGALFGAAEVTTVAFAEEQGQRWVAGWLLAAWSLGSLVAGLVTGAVVWRRGPDVRLRWGSAAMAATMAPLMFVSSVPVMALVLLVGGLAVAPTLISAMTMVEQGVPSARLTEGMAILHTGIVAGVAPGASIAGFVVDHSGASAAYAVALAGGVLGALAAQAARPTRTPRSVSVRA
ncbi:MFS family permease [Nocardioides cavernae]|uniref:MFS family permease n=1 Tax=Nocardioides cavernae TaxID=1921566 RepID=A0A7Y9H4V4_9ACTN|nr:MFS transporter [Nocardioides cavernae]NYE37925.1 MFS family permease [Nocardioides cavernae]